MSAAIKADCLIKYKMKGLGPLKSVFTEKQEREMLHYL